MHRRGPLPSFLLAFVVVAAWAVLIGAPAPASTGTSAAPAQAEPPPGGAPGTPDSSAVSPDSVSTAPPDSVSGARADSTAAVPPDSSAASTKAAAKQSVLPDTLEFLPPPGSQTGSEPKAGGAVGPPAPPPKQRVGLFGLTPIVILIGIAALHYFVIKAVAN